VEGWGERGKACKERNTDHEIKPRKKCGLYSADWNSSTRYKEKISKTFRLASRGIEPGMPWFETARVLREANEKPGNNTTSL